MNFKRATMMLVGASALALSGLVILPNAAFASSANSLWVNATGTIGASATGTSCATPGFTTIQAAIDFAGPGATVHVCSGTYVEQLQITNPVSIVNAGSSVTVELPASPANASTSCDIAADLFAIQPIQSEVSICTAGTVSIKGITVQALWPAGTCYDSLYGIFVAGGANLKMKDATMDGAGAFPANGCQGGVGIQVGRNFTSEVGTATLTDVKVLDYQKNGITVDGPGSSAKITGTTVTGAGPVGTAQNGIQISRGAKGTIKNSSVSGNECNLASPTCGSDGMNNAQGTGVLLYGAAAGSSVTHSSFDGNDLGVYAGAVTPNASTATISNDSFGNGALGADRYEAIQVDGAAASVAHDTVTGGNVGLQLLQYSGQPFATTVVAKSLSFHGLGVANVQIYSDQAPSGDLAGSLTISKSNVTGSLLDNSIAPNAFTVTLKQDT